MSSKCLNLPHFELISALLLGKYVKISIPVTMATIWNLVLMLGIFSFLVWGSNMC